MRRPLASLVSSLSSAWQNRKIEWRLLETGLFDRAYYLRNAPDVAAAGRDPLRHYLDAGAAEARLPNPLFDSRYYLTQHPDVEAAGINPLVHFFVTGGNEGRDPCPLFDASYYLEHNREVALSGENPLVHYLRVGAREGRNPNPLFDGAYYLEQNPDVAVAGSNPLAHYLQWGASEHRDPHPLFDTSYYLQLNPDTVPLNPLVHYLLAGAAEGRDPNPLFDTAFYRDRYGGGPPIKNALVDYLHEKHRERDPSPLFDASYYLAHNPTVDASGENPLAHYLRAGVRDGRKPRSAGPSQRVGELLASGELIRARTLQDLTTPQSPLSSPATVTVAVRVKSLFEELRERGGLVASKPAATATIVAPTVIGGQVRPPGATVKLPPEYVGVLDEVSVLGGTKLILAPDDLLLHDELAQFEYLDYGIKTPQVRALSGSAAVVNFRRPANNRIKTGVLLSSDHDNNYFHWLVECLPKLAFIDTFPEFAGLPLLIGEGLHPNLLAALEILNGGRRACLRLTDGHLYSVGRLVVPSDLSRIMDRYDGAPQVEHDCVLSPAWVRRAAELLGRAHQGPAAKPWRKLYLSRRSAGYRKVSNESDLELRLLEEGFEIVNLEGASVASQLALFRQSALVVAPTGAAVTNVMHCHPGTRFIVLTSDHPCSNFHIFSQLADIVQVKVEYVVGRRHPTLSRYAVHDDYAVDIDQVLKVLSPRA
ncbi:MAG: glycosyltransferase family 61 protein [Myxococcaceae bacterium]